MKQTNVVKVFSSEDEANKWLQEHPEASVWDASISIDNPLNDEGLIERILLVCTINQKFDETEEKKEGESIGISEF